METKLNAFANNELAMGVKLMNGHTNGDYEVAIKKAVKLLVQSFAEHSVANGINVENLRLETEVNDYHKSNSIGLFGKYKMEPNPFTYAYEYMEKMKTLKDKVDAYEKATLWGRIKFVFAPPKVEDRKGWFDVVMRK